MISKGLGRRQILRLPWGLAGGRLAGRRVACGGALFWTELVQPGGLPALAQVRVSTTPPLVMIDPGHGGHDPGATGVTGTLEKHITLAAGRMIKEALERDGRYRVELTRTEDLYVPREERVTIARALGADLFLSMHADVLSDASVRGASVYTLARAASDAETAALADRENGVGPSGAPGGYDPGVPVSPEVSGILASLAARETRAASNRMAHELVRDLGRRVPVLPSPERHANFTVLHAPGIPSVLIEMGFLSNPDDEAALNDPAHRAVIARAMTRAVDVWFAAPSHQS